MFEDPGRPGWFPDQRQGWVSSSRQIRQGIDRRTAATDLEMQAWGAGVGLTKQRNLVAFLDGRAGLNQELVVVRISRNEAVAVTKQNEIAQTAHPVAGIHDLAGRCGDHRVTYLTFDINAFGIGIETLDNLAVGGPVPRYEVGIGSTAWRRRCRRLNGRHGNRR